MKKDFCLDQKSFGLFCRELGLNFITYINFTPEALQALQTATEDFITKLFWEANQIAINAERDIVQVKDWKTACTLRGLLEDEKDYYQDRRTRCAERDKKRKADHMEGVDDE